MSQPLVSFKKSWKTLVILLIVTLGGGGLIGFLTRSSMEFYNTLSKPAFAPPGWLFPVAWGVLYTLMAVSIWLVLRTDTARRLPLLILYFAQLAVNLFWPILFFIIQALGLSFIWLVLLWALVLILTICCWVVNKVSGILLIPYILWTTFAAVLNFSVALLNP